MRLVKLLVVAAVVMFGASVVAQDKPSAGGQKEHTMGGCLEKGDQPDTFIVRNAAEKGPRVIGIIESKPNLAPHVGHHIDITGTAVPNKEAASMKDVPKADHYMRISAIKMVATTCKS